MIGITLCSILTGVYGGAVFAEVLAVYVERIPWLLEYLQDVGVQKVDITLLNSTGTHRGNTPEELDTRLRLLRAVVGGRR